MLGVYLNLVVDLLVDPKSQVDVVPQNLGHHHPQLITQVFSLHIKCFQVFFQLPQMTVRLAYSRKLNMKFGVTNHCEVVA